MGSRRCVLQSFCRSANYFGQIGHPELLKQRENFRFNFTVRIRCTIVCMVWHSAGHRIYKDVRRTGDYDETRGADKQPHAATPRGETYRVLAATRRLFPPRQDNRSSLNTKQYGGTEVKLIHRTRPSRSDNATFEATNNEDEKQNGFFQRLVGR